MTSDAAAADVVSYVTDIEGDVAYLERFASMSQVVRRARARDDDGVAERLRAYLGPGLEASRDALAAAPRLELVPGARLVFGGDLTDRGPGDLRAGAALLALRAAAPARNVTLLIGNRDANKARFASELAAGELALEPHGVPDPYWVPPSGRVSFASWLAAQAASGTPLAPHSRAARLRWMLATNMGSPAAFEHRRAELVALTGGRRVSDNEVAENFYRTAHPASRLGLVREYLESAQLVALVGPRRAGGASRARALVVHGAVDASTLGWLPGRVTSSAVRGSRPLVERASVPGPLAAGERGVDLDSWVAQLNDWYADQLRQWIARPEYSGATRGGEGAIAIANATAMQGRTVVYKSMLVRGAPQPLDPLVASALAAQRVSLVLSGHQPFGDLPLVICGTDPAAPTVVTADTCRSDACAADSRGAAVAEVLVSFDADSPRVRLRGTDRNERAYDFCLHDIPQVGTAVSLAREPGVNARASPTLPAPSDSWLVSRPLGNGAFVLRRGEGFTVHEQEHTL